MPTYTYKCNTCGKVFDIKASLEEKTAGDKRAFRCPACFSTAIVQQFNTINVMTARGGSEPRDDTPCASGNCCPGGACPY